MLHVRFFAVALALFGSLVAVEPFLRQVADRARARDGLSEDARALLGEWRAVSFVNSGEAADAERVEGIGAIFTRDRVFLEGDLSRRELEPIEPDEVQSDCGNSSPPTYCIDAGYRFRPHTSELDLEFDSTTIAYAIYKITKGHLSICLHSRIDGIRPENFEAPPRSRRLLFVLKRQKCESSLLEGTWAMDSSCFYGHRFPAEALRKWRVVFSQNKVFMRSDAARRQTMYRYQLHQALPDGVMAIDFISGDRTDLGICKLDGDALTIRLQQGNEQKIRPTDFESTPNSTEMIMVLHRTRE